MQGAPSQKPDCLSVEEMEMHLSAQETEEEREARATHLKKCANCATELTLLREFLEGEPRPEERQDVDYIAARLESVIPKDRPAPAPARQLEPAASWWERLFAGGAWAWVGAAAAAMLAVGVYIQQSRIPEVPGGLGGGTPVVRSNALNAVGPSGDLDAAPETLEVEAAADAVSYRFQLEEVDRTVVWTAESPTRSIALPAEARSFAIPGKTLIWRAFALDRSGSTIMESAPTRFRVQPGANP